MGRKAPEEKGGGTLSCWHDCESLGVRRGPRLFPASPDDWEHRGHPGAACPPLSPASEPCSPVAKDVKTQGDSLGTIRKKPAVSRSIQTHHAGNSGERLGFGTRSPHASEQSNCFLCQNFLDNLLPIVWLKEPSSHLGACLPNMIGSLEMKGTV